MRLLSIGETAAELGVAVGTLRRWHRLGLLMPACRTIGGHRRYQHDAVRTVAGAEPASTGKTICYARVSSHDQAEQLKTQALRLEKHCVESGFDGIEVISDLGSGLNYRKKGCSDCCRTSFGDASPVSCRSRKTACHASAASCYFALANSFASKSLSLMPSRMPAASSSSRKTLWKS